MSTPIEYQLVVAITLHKPHHDGRLVLDYCREQIQAYSDSEAVDKANRMIARAARPLRGELGIKSIEVWEPTPRIVVRDVGYLENEKVSL